MVNRSRILLLSLLSGVLAGLAATLFLYTLHWMTEYRLANPALIWALPFAGLLIGLLYHHFGKDVSAGNNLILDQIHDPTKVIPLRMAPFILIGTLLTHLFGGSAGREGTAVQMGASLSDQLTHFFHLSQKDRRRLLAAGAGAGFGAAIGTPWAGFIFGMEVIQGKRLSYFAFFECLIASFTAYFVSLVLGAPHSVFANLGLPELDFLSLIYVALAGIFFGVAAQFFMTSTHIVERVFNRLISYPPLKPFVGGLLLVALYHLEGSFNYAGLGISYIQQSLNEPVSFEMPLLKSLFTSLTIGSGFKGGEFIPLVYVGATLGSALTLILPVSVGLLSSVGFAAVFGAASRTPLACSVMAIEIFDWPIAPYAVLGCLIASRACGTQGIYSSQRKIKFQEQP